MLALQQKYNISASELNHFKLQVHNNRWSDGDDPVALHPPLCHYHLVVASPLSTRESSSCFLQLSLLFVYFF